MSNFKNVKMISHRSCIFIITSIRNFSTKIKPKVDISPEVINNIEEGVFKPRKHPGIFKPRTIHLPNEFINAVEIALNDHPAKQLLIDSRKLVNYLNSRHSPIEHTDYISKKNEIENQIITQHANFEALSDEEKKDFREKMKGKVMKLLKTKLYHWKAVDYNIQTSLQYLLGRSAAEYAALVRIFQEITIRDNEFKPRSFFDFGSGVGTATWAAKLFWQKNIFEYFNVDSSVHMNDLASILLKGGTGVKETNLKGVFYRQFLPATNATYDLVISAYSLLELQSSQARLETLLKLWNKTQKYLVIVEQGTYAGFKVVNEARDFIIQVGNKSGEGHVFSPCAHDYSCPKFLNSNNFPCNFDIGYMTIPIGQNSELKKERFSYVVLTKGPRTNKTGSWPRIVSPTLVRAKHAVCRMCTSEGKLEEIVFTAAKHGRIPYRCARATELGDLLPMSIESVRNSEET